MDPLWGTPTSSIDWCESNYVVHRSVAEFWNTISNVGLILAGCIGAYLKLKEKLEFRFVILDFYILSIGLGSAMFHATLLFHSQLADELPMVWEILHWTYVIREMYNTANSASGKLAKRLIIFGVAWTFVSPIIHRQHPVLFQLLFGCLQFFCLYSVTRMYKKCENVMSRRLYWAYLISGLVAFAFWLVDQSACSMLQGTFSGYSWWRYLGSLHGYWHLLMAVHAYSGSLFSATIRLETLRCYPTFKWLWGVVPYVTKNKL